ncbi:MAG: Uma2 family endonuclease [Verrucomicrobia bacterium]|nr:Uma2 family endonuclease [Verrucomicrobiota bacterium]
MTWQEVIEHPSLRDLPFKIELNARGQILMSTARISHGEHQATIARLLHEELPHGKVVTEGGVRTRENVKVPDVAWLTPEHWEIARHELACSTAPAICVEVVSDSNTAEELEEKAALYFAAGAQEVWICDAFGNMTFHAPAGQLAASALCPDFPATV